MLLQRLRFSVLIILAGLLPMANARRVKENQSVLVSVVDDAGVHDATVLVAEKMASQIYEHAGLLVVWKNCASEPGPRRQGCIETVDSGHLVLHIVHNTQTLGADVYGVAFLGEDGSGSYCDVFYDRIAALYHRGRTNEAKILAVVAAHELGHLLLGSHAHSQIGIMRPQLQAKDFWTPEPWGTAFTRLQAQKISDRLMRTGYPSRSAASGSILAALRAGR